jgi:hypothetical protein
MDPGQEVEVARTRTASEHKTVERTDSAQVEEILERRQSRITFATLPERQAEERMNVLVDDAVPLSATPSKGRTLSMEMHDTIDALYRKDEDEGTLLFLSHEPH